MEKLNLQEIDVVLSGCVPLPEWTGMDIIIGMDIMLWLWLH